jgi:hypothetical protein
MGDDNCGLVRRIWNVLVYCFGSKMLIVLSRVRCLDYRHQRSDSFLCNELLTVRAPSLRLHRFDLELPSSAFEMVVGVDILLANFLGYMQPAHDMLAESEEGFMSSKCLDAVL